MRTNDRPGAGLAGDGGGVLGTIKEQASSALSAQKGRAADGITAVIEAIRQTGGQLKEKNSTLAGYADSAAGQLERWSKELRDRDVSELMEGVSTFARRRPAVFIGGGLMIGLAAARFLKSSAQSSSSSSNYSERGGYAPSSRGQFGGSRSQQFAPGSGSTSPSMNSTPGGGSMGAPRWAESSESTGETGSRGSMHVGGRGDSPTSSDVGADQPTLRSPRAPRPRARTTDER